MAILLLALFLRFTLDGLRKKWTACSLDIICYQTDMAITEIFTLTAAATFKPEEAPTKKPSS